MTQAATNLIGHVARGTGPNTMGMEAVNSTIPITGHINMNNRVLRRFSMPPLVRANLGMAGTASADEHHCETMIERLMECIRQALGVQLKFPDGYKPHLKFDGSGPSKYDGSPKFSKLEKWLSALAYRYALLKFGGPDLDMDCIRVYTLVDYLMGDTLDWFTKHVLSPKRTVNYWTFCDVITSLYDRFVHPSSMQDARKSFRKNKVHIYDWNTRVLQLLVR